MRGSLWASTKRHSPFEYCTAGPVVSVLPKLATMSIVRFTDFWVVALETAFYKGLALHGSGQDTTGTTAIHSHPGHKRSIHIRMSFRSLREKLLENVDRMQLGAAISMLPLVRYSLVVCVSFHYLLSTLLFAV